MTALTAQSAPQLYTPPTPPEVHSRAGSTPGAAMSLIEDTPAPQEAAPAEAPAAVPAAAAPSMGAINGGAGAHDPEAEMRMEKAKEFLSNAKVQTTPLSRRVQFLVQKGMSLKEMQQAFAMIGQPKEMKELEAAAKQAAAAPEAANAQAMSAPPAAPQYHHPLTHARAAAPKAEPWGWKDYFIGGTLVSAAMWGLKAVANEFFDITVTWKDEAAAEANASPKAAKKKYAKELPPVPSASTQQVNEIEAKVTALESDRDKLKDDIQKVEEKEEELTKLVKASESMLKSGAETSSKVARIEGKMRMQDRLVERVNNLEGAKKAHEDEVENLKVALQNLTKQNQTLKDRLDQAGIAAPAEAEEGEFVAVDAAAETVAPAAAPGGADAPAAAATPPQNATGRTQLFRRDVPLDGLRALFREPRAHTGVGYHRVADLAQPGRGGKRSATAAWGDGAPADKRIKHDAGAGYAHPGTPLDEESEARAELVRLQGEAEAVAAQMREVQGVLDAATARREKAAAAAKAQHEAAAAEKARVEAAAAKEAAAAAAASAREARGQNVYYRSHQNISDHFDSSCKCLASGGGAVISLYDSGTWSFTTGLPTLLHNKLNGRQKNLPAPEYVALGDEGRYYIRFADGKSEWVGPAALTDTLNKSSVRVRTVAFGDDFDAYCVVFEDGDYAYSGVPPALHKLMRSRNGRCDVKCISLGPGGEYYMRTENGRAWWGGLSGFALHEVAHFKNCITFLDFGADGTFVLRYSGAHRGNPAPYYDDDDEDEDEDEDDSDSDSDDYDSDSDDYDSDYD